MKNQETNVSYPLLCKCFEELIRDKKKKGKDRTAANYQSAWNKFSYYLKGNTAELTVMNFTSSLIQRYVLWLLYDDASGNKKLSLGSQDFYLKNLKAMYNKVIKKLEYLPAEGNPFSNIHIKVPPTRKRALPKEEIRRLAKLDLSDTPHLASALHLALFLFYARGMCFIDAFNLRVENIREDYIYYTRSKTGVALQVKITPEMDKIIQTYRKKDSPWLFPFLHENMQGPGEITAQSSLHRTNRYLKEISEDQGYLYPLTTYVMRHSWATMMLEADTEISVISQSMGHKSLLTTEIYIGQLSIAKIDMASDNMLDSLIRNPKGKKRKAVTKSFVQPSESNQTEASVLTITEKSIKKTVKNFLAAIAARIF